DARARLGEFDPYDDITRAVDSCATDDPANRLIYQYCKLYLAGQNLVNTDRASMAVGLELRAPFLDHQLVELLGRVPSRLNRGRHPDPQRPAQRPPAGSPPAATPPPPQAGFRRPARRLVPGPAGAAPAPAARSRASPPRWAVRSRGRHPPGRGTHRWCPRP